MQENILGAVKSAGAGIAALATFLWGKPDYWLFALIAFMVLDYITGVVAAIIAKELSSKTGFNGLLKKLLFLVVVAVAHIIDTAVGAGGTIRSMVVGFLVANEGISILENCGRCGLPIPKKLLDVLQQLKENGQDTEE